MDGTTTGFTPAFTVLSGAEADIKCQTISTTGTVTVLTYLTDYTVEITSGVATVAVSDAGAVGTSLLIYRDTTNTQESAYDDYNQFPAGTIESDLDRRTLKSQEMEDDIDRALKASISSSLTSLELPTPSAGTALVWDSAGTGITNSLYDPDSQVSNASSYATNSLNSATDSASHATTSLGYATDASSHATTALGYATDASSHATTSLDAATAAASSATVAQEAADSIHTVGTITITTKATIALAEITNLIGHQSTAGTLNITTRSTIAEGIIHLATIGTLNITTKSTTAESIVHLSTIGTLNLTTKATIASANVTTATVSTLQIGDYKMPTSDGTVNQIFKTNGAGVISFTDEAPTGAGITMGKAIAASIVFG